MTELCNRDLREALSITGRALECRSTYEFEEQTLTSLERFVGAHTSVYFDIQRASSLAERSGERSDESATKVAQAARTLNPALEWRFTPGLSHGVSSKGPKTWCQHYQNQDPFVNKFISLPSSSTQNVVRSNKVIDDKLYRSSRFYNEFMKPQAVHHVMLLGLRDGGCPIGLYGLHRPMAMHAFSKQEEQKLQLMARHLAAAAVRLKPSKVRVEPQISDQGFSQKSLLQIGFTRRQTEVIIRLNQGLTNTQIADSLNMSVRTAQNHLRAMYQKLGVHNRTRFLNQVRSRLSTIA
jgi:DNA-binding CsgD family transcriptional regulator